MRTIGWPLLYLGMRILLDMDLSKVQLFYGTFSS